MTLKVREQDKTPTGRDALSGEHKTTLTELANFLYSEYEAASMDSPAVSVDDEDSEPLIEIQESQ